MIDKNIILGISIGIITGILLSFFIFLNVTPYRYGHVINYFTTLYPSSTQESTVPPTEVVPSIESDILLPIELTSWLEDNLAKTDIGYSASAEEFSRLNSPTYGEDVSYNLDTLDEQINNRRDFIVTTLNLDSPERNAPVNIELYFGTRKYRALFWHPISRNFRIFRISLYKLIKEISLKDFI